ncbi:MAG: sulfur reduction protein DsrS [Pseudomonadota bacterium]|nr:sulfur reduction protein DsrS [Pseudomonadota bacterium]
MSAEDNLRLNVLLANAKAIRINESKMTVHGLTGNGEASIALQPTGNEDRYLRLVRELLATHALSSPRGYPVFLRRWTRLHRLDTDRLEPLLMLGEPEAVVAVSGASSITVELAERAWWALPESEVARFLLAQKCVAGSKLGKELAAHLLEFLPFETEHADIIETVRLISPKGLIAEADLLRLWRRGTRKTSYLTGFLLGRRDDLPESPPANPALGSASKFAQAQPDNPLLASLCKVLTEQGQNVLATCRNILGRPASHEAVVGTLAALQAYLELPDLRVRACASHEEIKAILQAMRNGHDAFSATLGAATRDERLEAKLTALLTLALSGEPLVRGYFARSTAVGSLMRKQLSPILKPVERSLETLLSQ